MDKFIVPEAFKYNLVPMLDQRFFWVSFSGDVDLPSIGQAHQVFRNHPDYFDGIDELLDFSNASLKI